MRNVNSRVVAAGGRAGIPMLAFRTPLAGIVPSTSTCVGTGPTPGVAPAARVASKKKGAAAVRWSRATAPGAPRTSMGWRLWARTKIGVSWSSEAPGRARTTPAPAKGSPLAPGGPAKESPPAPPVEVVSTMIIRVRASVAAPFPPSPPGSGMKSPFSPPAPPATLHPERNSLDPSARSPAPPSPGPSPKSNVQLIPAPPSSWQPHRAALEDSSWSPSPPSPSVQLSSSTPSPPWKTEARAEKRRTPSRCAPAPPTGSKAWVESAAGAPTKTQRATVSSPARPSASSVERWASRRGSVTPSNLSPWRRTG